MALQPLNDLYSGGQDPEELARQQALKSQLGGPTAGPADMVSSPTQPLPSPTTPAPSAPAPAESSTPDPFAAMGGGTLINGGWVPNNNPAAQAQAGAQAVGTGGTIAASPGSVQGAFQQALQNLLTGPSPQQAGQNVMSSPAVTGYNLARTKQEGKDRAFAAERAAADGTSGSGGFESTLAGLRQAAGSDMAQYAGNQAAQEEQGRRQELLTALSLANQMGDSNAARALQLQLAQMQAGTAADQLALTAADRQAYWNNIALQNLFSGIGA